MHILAYIYHWDRDTIRKLPRRERNMWCEMIKLQIEAENKKVGSESSP